MSKPLYKEILYTKAQVDARVNEMAIEVIKLYKNRDVLFVCLLTGAQPFTFKLMQAIEHNDPYFHPNVQSIIVSMYGAGHEPKKPQLVTDLPPEYRDLKGRHIILLDDLIDRGGTTAFSESHLYGYGAKKVESIVLVKKRKNPEVESSVVMYGFETPDEWLTGMGMDDERLGKEANRWAEWIAIANPN